MLTPLNTFVRCVANTSSVFLLLVRSKGGESFKVRKDGGNRKINVIETGDKMIEWMTEIDTEASIVSPVPSE